jgi:hypothetical protein
MAAIDLPILTAQGRRFLPVLSAPSNPPTNDDFVASIIFENDLTRAYGERDTRHILCHYSNTKISLGQQKITKDDLINGYTYAKAMATKLLGSKNASGILFVDSPNNNLQYNSRVNPRKLRLHWHQHGLRPPWRLPLLL